MLQNTFCIYKNEKFEFAIFIDIYSLEILKSSFIRNEKNAAAASIKKRSNSRIFEFIYLFMYV